MSSKLLPGEKPRKKDIGTTSYKKPGPPTPSKNGGRLSLQGNEVLREQNDTKTPKRVTPNRIRALFRKTSSKDNVEVGLPGRRMRWTFCNHSPKKLSKKFLPCTHSCHCLPLVRCPKTTCIPECKYEVLKKSKTNRWKKFFGNVWVCTSHLIFVLSMLVATHYIKSIISTGNIDN